MAFGMLEEDDRLKLDPQIAAFIDSLKAKREIQGGLAAMPETPDANQRADQAAMGELKTIDDQAQHDSGLGYLGQILSRSGAMIRGEKAGALPAVPKVDDSVRKFILTRKLGAGQDPLKARLDALNVALKERDLAKPPNPLPVGQEAPDDPLAASLVRYGLDPKVYKTRSEAQGALNAAIAAGRAEVARADAISVADRREEERRAAADAREAARQAAADKKDEGKAGDALFIATDFEPEPGSRPVPPPVKTKLFDLASSGASMIKGTRELRDMVRKHGGGALTGEVAARMEALATDLVMSGKEIYGLGVLNPNDEVILGRIIANPTTIRSIASDSAGVKSLDAIYQALEDRMRSKVVESFKQAGQKPKPGTVFEAPRKVVERRKTKDGRILLKYEDGTYGQEGE